LKNKGNWIVMPLRERIFLVALVVYAVVFFLPWTHDITFLNLSIMVWGTYLLTFMAPIISIIFLLSEKPQRSTSKEPTDSNISKNK
jgi:hypothetical protein